MMKSKASAMVNQPQPIVRPQEVGVLHTAVRVLDQSIQPYNPRCEIGIDAGYIQWMKVPRARQVLEPEIPADTESDELRQLFVGIVTSQISRDVYQDPIGNRQAERVGQPAHDDLSHQGCRCLRGAS